MEVKELYKDYLTTHFSTGHKIRIDKKTYERYFRYFKLNYENYLPKNKNARIVDLGCGIGHFLFYLKKSNYTNFIGVDLGKQAVEFCKKHKLAPKIVYSDAHSFLKKSKEKFDVIIFNDIIEHIPKKDMIPLLKLMKNRLSKKGILIIKTPNCSNPITAGSSRYIDFTHTVGFTEESLSQVLKLAEFKRIKILKQNIFVFNPLINLVGHIIQGILNSIMYLLFLIYGRKTTKIFTKDIIAIAYN